MIQDPGSWLGNVGRHANEREQITTSKIWMWTDGWSAIQWEATVKPEVSGVRACRPWG